MSQEVSKWLSLVNNPLTIDPNFLGHLSIFECPEISEMRWIDTLRFVFDRFNALLVGFLFTILVRFLQRMVNGWFWGPVVWDSNRGTPKNPNPVHKAINQTSEDEVFGVYFIHFRNARYLGSMKPFGPFRWARIPRGWDRHVTSLCLDDRGMWPAKHRWRSDMSSSHFGLSNEKRAPGYLGRYIEDDTAQIYVDYCKPL